MPDSHTPDPVTPSLTAARPRARPKGNRTRRLGGQFARNVLPPLLLLIVLLIAWEALVQSGAVSEIIVAPPSATVSALGDVISAPGFAYDFWITAYEAIFGAAIGLLAGLLLGVASGVSKLLNRTLYPFVVFFQGLPKPVLAPLFVTWFGFGPSSKVVLVAVITFFPIFVNTLLGLNSYDASALNLMRSYGASGRQVFFKLQFPSALPSIFAGAKTSLSFALVGAIVAEFLGARDGLGYLILQNTFLLKTDRVFALIMILGVLGVVIYLGVEWLYRKIVFWQDHDLLL
jgi:NitT/TauT family transport system permease protein